MGTTCPGGSRAGAPGGDGGQAPRYPVTVAPESTSWEVVFMRLVSLDKVQTGMTLGRTIFGSSGQILLKAGVEIKPQYLFYLQNIGINSLYVQDSRLEDIEVDDVIREETRRETRSLVQEIMKGTWSNRAGNRASKSLVVNCEKLKQTVTKIVQELLENKDAVACIMDIRARDDYIFAHSVNCSVLAVLTAAKMGYDTGALKCLALGALLHDIGMAAVPVNILEKPGELTLDEMETVKNHSLYGYEFFKRSPLFSTRAGEVILQHHERCNGKGYPRGLRGEEIDPLAQVVAVADVYDALTSERPYRPAYQPYQAVEMLLGWGEELFDRDVLQDFLFSIAAYPVGTHVVLSGGESGLVTYPNPGLSLRPVVRVLYKGEGLDPHPRPYDLDMSRVLDVVITRVIE